ncbi:hypothetical protein E2493_15855 [Sphingomonas parva]|uniref:Uncharacterized protein n=1 Tax=Sphingomonas parva TaxID=2555898 RepID=A0A4Y8ZSE1_9SPHN|nr:hypothetical protein [Sphingomonas parva]TFI57336.1 hypothetical protein E2493_15855 [Sphingomonas parva]
MAISDDPTRGTGPDKVTEAAAPGVEAPPGARDTEPSGSATPDPARGGCLRLGWGCLPLLIGATLIPPAFFF